MQEAVEEAIGADVAVQNSKINGAAVMQNWTEWCGEYVDIKLACTDPFTGSGPKPVRSDLGR